MGGTLEEETEEQSGFSEGCIVKSMHVESSTVEFVDQPHAYRMSMRRASIAWAADAAPLQRL